MFIDEIGYGWNINTHYDYINMLIKMEVKNPRRFEEFEYSEATIYHYLDKIQQEQNIYD